MPRRGAADVVGCAVFGLGVTAGMHRRIPHLIHSRSPYALVPIPGQHDQRNSRRCRGREPPAHAARRASSASSPPGLYTWMPLGLRAMRKVENIVREEMNRAGALES